MKDAGHSLELGILELERRWAEPRASRGWSQTRGCQSLHASEIRSETHRDRCCRNLGTSPLSHHPPSSHKRPATKDLVPSGNIWFPPWLPAHQPLTLIKLLKHSVSFLSLKWG